MIVLWAYSLVKASGMSRSVRIPRVSITCSVMFSANESMVGIESIITTHHSISFMKIARREGLIEKLRISIE
jgi:hypothetical protein